MDKIDITAWEAVALICVPIVAYILMQLADLFADHDHQRYNERHKHGRRQHNPTLSSAILYNNSFYYYKYGNENQETNPENSVFSCSNLWITDTFEGHFQKSVTLLKLL